MTETPFNRTLEYQRELEVRDHTDVLVAGGGPAGVAAALAVARQGKTVRPIEAHSCLDGMGTAGMGNDRIIEAFGNGILTVEDPHLVGIWRTGATLGGGNVAHTFGLDGTDESLTKAYLWARKTLPQNKQYYK